MFASVFEYIKLIYSYVFVWLDNIKLIGGFSLLDFCIIILVLGMIIPVVVTSLKYSAVRSVNSKSNKSRHRRGESDTDE